VIDESVAAEDRFGPEGHEQSLPGMDNRVIGRQLLHSDLEPLPLYRNTSIPYLQSNEIRPILHTHVKSIRNRELLKPERLAKLTEVGKLFHTITIDYVVL